MGKTRDLFKKIRDTMGTFHASSVLLTYDGDLRDPLWWRQERPVPMRVARGPLGIPLP